MLFDTLAQCSQYHGFYHVRSTTSGPLELLYGTVVGCRPRNQKMTDLLHQVSAGEEAITVGSAAALGPNDVITCQYRETGVFQQRGFTLKDFMSQLFSNKDDPGKGRNMPVHYSGKAKVGAVCFPGNHRAPSRFFDNQC